MAKKKPSSPISSGLNPSLFNEKMKVHRFAGVSLAGGKTDKTCVALLEYYPDHEKIFLSRLYEKLGADKKTSADSVLYQLLSSIPKPLERVAFDAPLSFPKCTTCRLKCPGYESCKVSEIQWMHKQHQRRSKKKRPNKHFTPYTERCSEIYISNELEEGFHPSHALGANAAPLTARAHFLKRRIGAKTIEVYPKLSIWRVGRALKIPKSHLRYHKHSVGGDVSREYILRALVEKNIAFIYQQDIKAMIAHHQAFEAFIAGLTAYLEFMGLCEKRPKGFPAKAAWLSFPQKELSW